MVCAQLHRLLMDGLQLNQDGSVLGPSIPGFWGFDQVLYVSISSSAKWI